jgi:surface antigen
MRNKLLLAVAFTASVIFIGCKGKSSNDPITLKFNAPKGQKFEYGMDMDMTMKAGMDMKMKMGMGYQFEVTGDSAGYKTVSSTFSKIGMNMNMMGMSMDFDSDKPSTDTAGPMAIMGKMLGAMKGGKFTFTMNEKGEVGSVTGMKEMMEKAFASIDVNQGAMMTQSIGKSFDEASFKKNIEQSFAAYPDKPVKPGDTWTKTTNNETQGMKMKMDNTYTLESVTDGVANIKTVSKISSASDTTTVKMDMKGDATGTMKYDVATGMPLGGVMDMKMQVNVPQMPKPMDMDMKMTFKGKKL